MMEICPEAPGFFDLLAMWGRGERTFQAWLAFASFLWVVFVIAVLVVQTAHVS